MKKLYYVRPGSKEMSFVLQEIAFLCGRRWPPFDDMHFHNTGYDGAPCSFLAIEKDGDEIYHIASCVECVSIYKFVQILKGKL